MKPRRSEASDNRFDMFGCEWAIWQASPVANLLAEELKETANGSRSLSVERSFEKHNRFAVRMTNNLPLFCVNLRHCQSWQFSQ